MVKAISILFSSRWHDCETRIGTKNYITTATRKYRTPHHNSSSQNPKLTATKPLKICQHILTMNLVHVVLKAYIGDQ